MTISLSVVAEPTSLTPLPEVLRYGLAAVSIMGFLSFFLSAGLLIRLTRTIICGRKHKIHQNQFIILIACLVLADIQQALAFLLNSQWLGADSISVGSKTCWAQGWFVSTGDLASGIFTLAIATHTFIDIVFDYRLPYRSFLSSVGGLWIFVYAMAVIGVAMHPSDFYVRAGAWCWINGKYANERLWLHYFWILIAEFGTVLIYALMFYILRRRVKSNFYATSPSTAVRARATANAIVLYPLVYVVCTLPLAAARIASMSGAHVNFTLLCVGGAMITSNGWLDVLLYSFTRRALIFNANVPQDMRALDTFTWRGDDRYGTTTIIEATAAPAQRRKKSLGHRKMESIFATRETTSTEELVDVPVGMVKAETEVRVQHRAMELGEMRPSLGARSHSDRVSSSKHSLGKEFDEY